nr:hypothetical protein [Methanobrevibacter arboriphilus]
MIIILYDVDHHTVSYAFFSSKTTGVPDDARLHYFIFTIFRTLQKFTNS